MANIVAYGAGAAAIAAVAFAANQPKVQMLVDPNNQTSILPDGSRVAAHVAGKPLAELMYPDAPTIYESYARGARLSKGRRMMASRRTVDGKPGPYEWITYDDFLQHASDLASAFGALGIKPGQETIIGIFSKNRPEWIITEMAAYMQSMVTSPLYETLGKAETIHVCKLTEMPLVVVDSACKAKKLLANKPELPHLAHIVVIEATEEALKEVVDLARPQSVGVQSYAELLARGRQNPTKPEPRPPKPDDLATICFTSGTTGMPKGAMLTHKNVVADLTTLNVLRPETCGNQEDVMISFLPLAHMFERMMELAVFSGGGAIGYFRGDIKGLADDIKELRPTIVPVVPRVLNRIYDKVYAEASKSSIKLMLLNAAVAFKKQEIQRGVIRNDSIVDHVVFKKIRDGLGGRVRLMVTGSAPIGDNVLTFIRCALGCVVVEGYGQTECVAGCTLSTEGDAVPGHVGIPVPSVAVKLFDIPEMNYVANRNGGEICVRGNSVFKGYYKNEVETKNALDAEGWLHTGDIGVWTSRGTLKVVDRKKHIFKLAQGEYVAPEKIENVYVRSKLVAQAFVHGEGLKTCVVALIVPDAEVLLPTCRDQGITGTLEELCANTTVKKLILNDITAEGRMAGLHGFEQVKDIFLLSEPFSVENDLLTPTLKSKRNHIKQRYQKELADMYSRLD